MPAERDAILSTFPSSCEIIDAREGPALSLSCPFAAVAEREKTLTNAHVGAGDRLVLVPTQPLGFFADLFAAWNFGAVAVCASPSLTAGECERVNQLVRPRLWLGSEGPAGVPSLGSVAFKAPRAADPALMPGSYGLDDAALILLTSGTSGTPKGVVHTLRSLQARLALNLAHIGPADLAVGLNVLPLHFGHGLIGNCLTVLAAGGRLVLHPEPGIDGLARLGEIIDTFDVTFLSSVPAMWRVVLKTSPPPRRRTLRRVHVGSAPLSAELWSAICDWCGIRRVLNMYGMTEAANWIAGHSAENGPPADGLVGRPWGGAVRVRTESGAILERGSGEILLASPTLMSGYLDHRKPEQLLPGGWFYTGDIGEISGAGEIRLLGRVREDVNRGGIKIYCAEIDLLLERHPLVREACAFPLEDAVHGEIVGVAVVPESGQKIDLAALRKWCSEHIRREAVPDRFFVLDALPSTERGKRLRGKVREFCLAGSTRGRTS